MLANCGWKLTSPERVRSTYSSWVAVSYPDDGLLAVADEYPQAEPVGATPVRLGHDVRRLAVVPDAAQVAGAGDVQPRAW